MNTDGEIRKEIVKNFKTLFKDRNDLHDLYKRKMKNIITTFLQDLSKIEYEINDYEEYIEKWVESHFVAEP